MAGSLSTASSGSLGGEGRLTLDPFERLVEEARSLAPAEAAPKLREALALFRGPPLDDAPLEGPAASEPDRLAALRLGAFEPRVVDDLPLARHADVIAELEAFVAANPYRERLQGQ